MKKILFILFILSFLLVSCSSSSVSSEDINCIDVEIYKCNGFDPRGTLTNNCTRAIWMAKLVVTGYDANNEKVDGDEEYVEDLAPGKEKDFEAVFSENYGSRISSCSVRIEEVKFK